MTELIFKKEWDCIKPDGSRDFKKAYEKYSTDFKTFYIRSSKQLEEYLELNREYILEHRKRFDKALLFNFGDNDFQTVIRDMMVNNFIYDIKDILNEVDTYITDESIESRLNRKFNKESLLVKMKYWFISQYMVEDAIERIDDNTYDTMILDFSYKEAKKITKDLFKDADLFIGTNEEINQIAKEYFGEGQNDPDNVDKYWCNGEVFILRIINNKVTYTIR